MLPDGPESFFDAEVLELVTGWLFQMRCHQVVGTMMDKLGICEDSVLTVVTLCPLADRLQPTISSVKHCELSMQHKQLNRSEARVVQIMDPVIDEAWLEVAAFTMANQNKLLMIRGGSSLVHR